MKVVAIHTVHALVDGKQCVFAPKEKFELADKAAEELIALGAVKAAGKKEAEAVVEEVKTAAEEEKVEFPDLTALKKKELLAFAAEHGVEVTEDDNKEELIAKIEEALLGA